MITNGPLRDLRVMVGVAALVRVPVVLLKYPGFPPGWGGEMASVASALASGEGFASPYWASTGPTALVPPVYPAFLSLVFRAFGNHTPLAGGVALAIGIVISASICIPTVLLARRLFGEQVGILSGWFWAVLPLSGHTDALYIWNTSMFALVLTTFLLMTCALAPDAPRGKWVVLGVVTGLLMLVEPSGLFCVAAAFLWLLVVRRPRLSGLLLALAVAAVPPALWSYRNYRIFGEPVFLRSGLGLQLAQSLVDEETVPTIAPRTLPNRSPAELRRYTDLGELAYMRERYVEATTAIRQAPERYVSEVVRRVPAFWVGSIEARTLYWFYGRLGGLKMILYALPALGALAGVILLAWRRREEWSLAAAVLVCFPVPYYLMRVEFRYRLPLEPLMMSLCAGVCFAIVASLVARDRGSRAFGTAGG